MAKKSTLQQLFNEPAGAKGLRWLLAGLDDPGSQDPAGFAREDLAVWLREVVGDRKEFHALWVYLHSADYNRAGLAKRLRALR